MKADEARAHIAERTKEIKDVATKHAQGYRDAWASKYPNVPFLEESSIGKLVRRLEDVAKGL